MGREEGEGDGRKMGGCQGLSACLIWLSVAFYFLFSFFFSYANAQS